MAKEQLIAVDGTVTFSRPGELTPQLIEAYSNTNTFAQAAARKVGDPSSRAYFDKQLRELQVLGWNVLSAGTTAFHLDQNRISPAGIVSSILNPFLDAQGQAELGGILNAINQPDVSISNFLDFFWKHASVNAGKTNMAFGPLWPKFGQPTTTILYYDFNFSADSWRSVFVQRDTADLRVNAYHITMNLNMALYERVREALMDRLAGKQADHIATAELDI